MAKYAISGASHYGKTSVIGELARRGYETCPEAATDILREYRSIDGKDLRDKDPEFLEMLIIARQTRREARLKGPISFVDRGLPEVLLYCEELEIILPKEKMLRCMSEKYDTVFILEEIDAPQKENKVRRSTPETRRQFQKKLYDLYEGLGMKIIPVPAMSPQERADFILNHIESGE